MKFFRCIKRVYIFPLIVLCIIIFRTQLYEEWNSKHSREILKSQNAEYISAKYEINNDKDVNDGESDNLVKPGNQEDNNSSEEFEFETDTTEEEIPNNTESEGSDRNNLDNLEDNSNNLDNLEYNSNNLDNVEDNSNNLDNLEYNSNNLDNLEYNSNNLDNVEDNSNSLGDVEDNSNSLGDVEDNSNNLDNLEDKSNNLDNLEYNSNNLDNVEDNSNSLGDVEDNSNSLGDVEDNSNNLDNLEDNSNNLDNLEDKSNNLDYVEDNSNNLDNVEDNSNSLGDVEDNLNNPGNGEDNSNVLGNEEDNSNVLGNLEDNSNNLENVEDNSNNLENMKDGRYNPENVEDNLNNSDNVENDSNILENVEDDSGNLDKDDDKSNTTAGVRYNTEGDKNERKSPDELDSEVDTVDENSETIIGPGHMGVAVVLDKNTLTEIERHKYEDGYSRNSFNEYVSDMISMDRKLPDTRNPLCENERYPADLPDTSVVICFLNEAWSLLVRSVHSVMNTAPEHLLKEIILVDDFSDHERLKRPLEEYMGQRWEGKVRIVRNRRREGLIRSRLIGARQATGKTITFLDSHVECVQGWLEPLLGRIKEEPTHLVCPEILAIHPDTFEVKKKDKADEYLVGGFDWNMRFVWEYPAAWSLQKRPSVISPIKTPTIAGGLFSIDRDYFFTMGSYDEGMDFWGGENLEISFRMWMCGGTLEVVPCSVVHHVFRAKNPNSDSQHSNSVFINTLRMARVWMGEYMDIHYRAIGQADYQEIKVDVESRLELRERLQCRDFKWYIDNIYPALFLPQKALEHGTVMNVGRSGYCLHASSDYPGTRVTLETCVKDSPLQRFYRTATDEVRQTVTCVDIGTSPPQMEKCHHLMGNQQLQYTQDKSLRHSDTNRCLEFNLVSQSLYMEVCDGSELQKWTWVDG